MAFKYPITLDELSKISGVNPGKATKYGKPFLAVIEKYVKENEIERTEDVVIKSVVNKSAKKVVIITNIDKKIALADIARSQNMKMDELLSEIENIVYSGIDALLLGIEGAETEKICYDCANKQKEELDG
jgi:ATP-dependent DNA helicase RecQ